MGAMASPRICRASRSDRRCRPRPSRAVREPVNKSRFGNLEVITRFPQGEPRATPLLFVHGAYSAAWCWEENFLPFFAEAGYSSYALSLRGHGGSHGREYLDSFSIADYVADVTSVAAELPAAAVLIGHSMGGMVVQKYLEQAKVPAAVLMCSVPPQGLWASALGLAFQKPGLFAELDRLLGGGRMAVEALREALFAQPVSADLLRKFYRSMQPESHRAIWDMTLFNLPHLGAMHRVPMLVVGGEHDHLMPASLVEMTARSYGQEAEIFPGMGHGLMLERDWQKVAARIRAWLEANGM
jgi:pimeloyl-ACP methyl ester carboxylesterase